MKREGRRKGFNHEELVCTQGNRTHKRITRKRVTEPCLCFTSFHLPAVGRKKLGGGAVSQAAGQ